MSEHVSSKFIKFSTDIKFEQ